MKVIKNYSYVNENQKKLIEKGYGKLSVHSLNFDRYYSDEEKEKNRKNAETMTTKEWNLHCDEIAEYFGIKFNDIVNKFIESKYNIHQITENTSTMEHYQTNWDLYFYSNKGWNNTNYMDFFKLSLNEKNPVEKNLKLVDDVLEFVDNLEYKNISCTIQYTFIADNEKIDIRYNELCELLKDKFIQYNNMIGKIKVVVDNEKGKLYGFFKKGSKKKYYSICKENVILLNQMF